MQKIIYTALFTLGVFAVVATPVSAKVLGEQSQSQKAQQEIKCEQKVTGTGSYGEITSIDLNCNGSQTLEQSQSQKILGYSTDGKRIHYPVNTALDGTTMAAALGLATIGGLSYAAKRKIA